VTQWDNAQVNSPTVRVAAIQMVSTTQVATNLRDAATLVGQAAQAGARLVVLPEYFCLMGRRERDKVALREQDGSGPVQDFLSQLAARHRIWLAGGTVPLASSDPDRVCNTLPVYDPHGRRVARYDKVHLFSFHDGEESYDEARTIVAGREPVSFQCRIGEAPGGALLRVGLSVCYDLRFPELYRRFAGAELVLVPAAFTAVTGRAHWEVLLRARAIENLCYVLAAAQGGQHENGRATWGHSMLVDPWGEVVAVHREGPGVLVADLDLTRIASARQRLPALEHRVF
jgi:predicted amidohydrolase